MKGRSGIKHLVFISGKRLVGTRTQVDYSRVIHEECNQTQSHHFGVLPVVCGVTHAVRQIVHPVGQFLVQLAHDASHLIVLRWVLDAAVLYLPHDLSSDNIDLQEPKAVRLAPVPDLKFNNPHDVKPVMNVSPGDIALPSTVLCSWPSSISAAKTYELMIDVILR